MKHHVTRLLSTLVGARRRAPGGQEKSVRAFCMGSVGQLPEKYWKPLSTGAALDDNCKTPVVDVATFGGPCARRRDPDHHPFGTRRRAARR